jgi:hypothetical protein
MCVRGENSEQNACTITWDRLSCLSEYHENIQVAAEAQLHFFLTSVQF